MTPVTINISNIFFKLKGWSERLVSGGSRERLDSSEEEEGLFSREQALKGNFSPSLKEAAADLVSFKKEKMVEENGLHFLRDTSDKPPFLLLDIH